MNKIVICSGRSNIALATEICQISEQPMCPRELYNFDDGETYFRFLRNVRGASVFLVQSTNQPDKNLIELLQMIDASKRASAEEINAVIPYFGYARQDRKSKGRESITAKLVANMIIAAGAHRIITMDLHAAQIQGFFDEPVDHLYGYKGFESSLTGLDQSNLVVATTDIGAVKTARAYAKRLSTTEHQVQIAIIDKRRGKPNDSDVMNVVGNVDNKDVLIVDDIVDTAGSLCNAAEAYVKNGAKSVRAVCTHAVLSPPAVERIQKSSIDHVWVSNTIYHERAYQKIEVVSVANIFADAIKEIHNQGSVSGLFPERE